ncbi:MAG: ABC transporter permease [Betaproteobacteria bacterium]|nr:ABC transporter permease [Betaproteobacteria bacterium]
MKALTIARYCLLEAFRTRYLWWLFGMLLVLLSATFFLRSLAVTESARIQLGVFAAFARIGSVFIITLHVSGTLIRQFNDKETELLFALNLTRADYLLGRFLGYAGVSVLTAFVVALFVAMLGPDANLLAWGGSLAFELMLTSAVTLFFVVSFVQIAPAVLFVASFYLLARSISALQLISHSPLLGVDSFAKVFGQKAMDFMALLLPRLDDFTQTGWLLEPVATPALGSMALQAGAYLCLILGAGLFDLQRKEL